MTFAALDYLSISTNVLMLIFGIIICPFMVLIILMQRPKQDGLGAAFGAGVTDQVFGARTTNVLQKGTVYLASAFFIISLVLAILIGKQNQTKSLLVKNSPKTELAKPVVPVAPKSLSEELPETTPTPVTPPTPEVEVPAPAPNTTPTAPPEETPAPSGDPAPSGSTEKTEGQ